MKLKNKKIFSLTFQTNKKLKTFYIPAYTEKEAIKISKKYIEEIYNDFDCSSGYFILDKFPKDLYLCYALNHKTKLFFVDYSTNYDNSYGFAFLKVNIPDERILASGKSLFEIYYNLMKKEPILLNNLCIDNYRNFKKFFKEALYLENQRQFINLKIN